MQPYQSAEKLPVKVIAISNSMDLAILSVDDAAFFANRPALPLDDVLPRVKASVNVFGYPVGGNEMSVTEGITSRVEYTQYHFGASGLRIQIDAALNPGNSGGPAISNGKVIGVAFSGLAKADNIGYVIPVDEVRQFLDDILDGKCDGKPRLWDDCQSTDNDALRASLKIPKDVGGCVITRVDSSDDSYPLKESDVITHIGPHALDRSGHVRLGDDLQVHFTYYLPKLARDGKAPFTVIRDGQSMDLHVPVPPQRNRVIPFLEGGYPRYFILGPMVFSTAYADMASGIVGNQRWLTYLVSKNSPLVSRFNDLTRFDGEEFVIVPTPYFSHRLAKGYESPVLMVVERMNNVRIKNLAHLVELLRDSKEEFLSFKLAGSEVEKLVSPRQAMLDSTEDVLTDNGIRKQCSDELEAIWNK